MPCRASRPPRTRIATCAKRRDRLEQRLVARLQPGGAHPRAVEPLRGVDEPAQLALLLPERLDDAHAGDALVDDLRDVALALLAVPGGREDPLPHPVGDREQRRQTTSASSASSGESTNMTTSDSSIISTLPVISGRKFSRPCTSAESEFARETSWPVGSCRERREVEALQVVVHRVAQVELHAEGRAGRRGSGARRRART